MSVHYHVSIAVQEPTFLLTQNDVFIMMALHT